MSKIKLVLTPNYKANFDKRSKTIQIHPVITSIYTSWRNGELVFRNMSFENILKRFKRHYEVKIINENRKLSNEKFNSNFRANVPLEKVLGGMKQVYNISYKVGDKKISCN